MKNVSEMKSSLDGLNIAEERIGEPKHISIERI